MAQANVYATKVRINGSTDNISLSAAGNVTVSYLLNEDASGGVSIAIKSGETTVRTINLAGGALGTLRGANSVVWDGKDAFGQMVGSGSYSVSITTLAHGYDNWTQISHDDSNYVFQARGIAVNKNPTSPFYGRIFVSNSTEGNHPESNPGDNIGILKFNSDESWAEEGVFSDGGYPWKGLAFSPWKIEVSDDDFVYVNDYSDHGLVLSFDQTISSNSLQHVLRSDNWTNGGLNLNLEGPYVTGSGTNKQVWMADASQDGVGIRRWNVTTNGMLATNDLGSTIVQSGTASDLNFFPEDVAVDKNNRIYTIQNTSTAGSSAYRLMRFAPYSGTPELVAEWKTGANDDSMSGAYGIAVDPTAAYVAVAFRGLFTTDYEYGGASVFNASNGSPVVSLSPSASPSHDHWDVAWDNAGNLYTIDAFDSVWRVYSPPGTNQSTTLALSTITVAGPPTAPPNLTKPDYANGQFTFILAGEPYTTYIIQYSTNFADWISIATNNSVLGTRQISVFVPTYESFFRAIIGPHVAAEPVLAAPAFTADQFRFTLLGETNASYIILSSTNLQAWTPIVTNSAGSASRAITITTSNKQEFFRALLGP